MDEDRSAGSRADDLLARALSLHLEAADLYSAIGLIDWSGRSLAAAARCAATPRERTRFAALAIHALQRSGRHDEAIRVAQEFEIAAFGDNFIVTGEESKSPTEP
jgi:hypothetical protein